MTEIELDSSNNEYFVHVYTEDVSCSSNNESYNDENYNKYRMRYQFFMKYDNFIKYCKESNLDYNGPKEFKEFEEKIHNDEIFDLSLSLNLNKEKKEDIITVNNAKQTLKNKIKGLF